MPEPIAWSLASPLLLPVVGHRSLFIVLVLVTTYHCHCRRRVCTVLPSHRALHVVVLPSAIHFSSSSAASPIPACISIPHPCVDFIPVSPSPASLYLPPTYTYPYTIDCFSHRQKDTASLGAHARLLSGDTIVT
ncbi:hypothetical protein K466DRAFT_388253 [Polyporus arcularius HHB13444]|uniref:Uncharacterized protein n=1 Tax=Polyporus arcularius HHB13444 TaxID=1314778 RepID=A0A5C3PMU3_9APHY|nr:hypothetical protein K466DRAFT_388253 [Polyporus arcularius HHB13444]